ncbi:lipid-binding SYLF domain-containing protein [Lutibaculum baratangense]|uniref:Ysc84 actin-binding domain-containing protein n=1 Tax=Lutibaculum baratangense AMV1 TaxID=631454 RepID=V4QU53_9HYPH|nr:lipid-binding SYLF domain-containing protein [Lutibaculum baratangense]ESR23302.1 hypothetical protein N177_3370 [Lutibaculum baratangense AMV1]
MGDTFHVTRAGAVALAFMTAALPVAAQEADETELIAPEEGLMGVSPDRHGEVAGGGEGTPDGTLDRSPVENQEADNLDARLEAQELLDEAARVADALRHDSDLMLLLGRARAVFIVPEYAKGALLVGGSSGEGVMLMNETEGWGQPVFYDVGSFEVGPAVGAASGAIAMLLMTEDAVSGFLEESNFSLDANAGLTLVEYSAEAQGSWGNEDVVLWTDMTGLFAGVTLGLSDIAYDGETTNAYYGGEFTPAALLGGQPVEAGGTERLRDALPG